MFEQRLASSHSRLAAIIFALAIATALLLYDPSAHAATSKRCALALCTLTLAAWSARFRATTTSPPALSAWLSLCALASISLLWSTHPHWEDAALWLTSASLALCALRLPAHDRGTLVRGVALLTLLGSAAVTLTQALMGVRGAALHGGLGNPNWLGITLACALPHALASTSMLARKWRLATRAALLAAALPTLAMAGSGTAWVALAIAAVISLRGRARSLATALGAALLTAGWWLGPLARSWSGRLWIWRHTTQAALDTPWLGRGLGGFAAAFLDAQGHALRDRGVEEASRLFVNATSAHNDWLQLWIELGALGPLLLASVLMLGWQQARHDIAARATLAIVALTACGDMALRLPPVAVVLALTLICPSRPTAHKPARPPNHKPTRNQPERHTTAPPESPDEQAAHRERQPSTLRRFATALLPLAAMAIAAALNTRRWLAERHLQAAADATPDVRITKLEQLHHFDPSYADAQLTLGTALLQVGLTEPAREHLRGSVKRLPNAGTYLALGNAWLRDAQPKRAIHAYRAALAWQPGSFRAHLNLAAAHLQAAQLDRAEQHYALARELQPHHPKLRRLRQQLDLAKAAQQP